MSTVPVVTHPSGRQFRLGRKPSAPRRHVALRHYLRPGPGLPVPPRVVHYTYAAEASVAEVYGNDDWGCCAEAAPAHALGIWRGNAGSDAPPITTDQVLDFYRRCAGFDRSAGPPGSNPTDQGSDLVTVLDKWKNEGFFADGSGRIEGWAAVDATNYDEVRAALYLFETLYTGVNMPAPWVNPMPTRSGAMWGLAGPPDPSLGHATLWTGYNDQGVFDVTWGMVVIVTPAAVRRYFSAASGGEVYVPLSREIINRATNKAPSGADYEALHAALSTT